MPHARKNDFYTREKTFRIFVFLDQNESQCFVWKTSNPNLKSVFEVHYFLHNKQTKEMFERGKNAGTTPGMYVLEEILAPESVAFKHCIAWTKYFMSNGYESLNYDIHKGYTEHMDEDTQAIFARIRNEFLFDVCAPEKRMFADYGTIRKKRGEGTPSNISIVLSPEEYQKIKTAAEEHNLKPSAYVKRMALDGEIRLENYSFFLEYKDRLRVIERGIEAVLIAICETRQYRPEDLERLKELCDQVGEIHGDAMKVFNNGRYKRRTKKPKDSNPR